MGTRKTRRRAGRFLEHRPRLRAVLGLSAAVVTAPALAQPTSASDVTPTVQPPAPAPTNPAPAKRAAKATPASVARDIQEDQADEAREPSVSPLTVTAKRDYKQEYGAVVGDIRPELEMGAADIQSYGVSTVTELLTEIAPQTRSDRGRTQQGPVILLNGRRISSINEVQNIPTEAILRIDILPEEVSLKYGYTADQRVVNIVLKRYFRAFTAEGVGGETTDGGDATAQTEADQFQVSRNARTNFDLKYQYAAGLTDAERGLSEPASGPPFDLAGNVASPTGGEIDPALSALVGRPVTIAGVPAGVASNEPPTLADFAPTAGVANVTDTAADHSLLPATQSLTGNAVLARPIFWGLNATFNATLTGATSDALQGPPGVSLSVPAGDPFSPFANPVLVDRYIAGESPLRQNIDGWTGHLGLTLNRDLGSWRLSLTMAYNHADTITTTGVGLDASMLQAELDARSALVNPFGPLPASLFGLLAPNVARAITNGGNVQILANGPLMQLPAGPLYASAKLGDVEAATNSSSRVAGLSQRQMLARNIAQGQLNLDLPLADRARHVLPALGELSVNANALVDEYSDFGPLLTFGYGVNWTPFPGYNVIFSESYDHAAPTLQQLDGPVVSTPGVRLFDFATGQTATVTQLSGGNPGLKADDRHVMKVGLTLKPLPTRDLTLTANYISSHISNAIATFPAASASIEAAFPSRFVRNDDGDLVEEDDRAVNFASQDRQELRWGINFSMPVGRQPPPRALPRPGFARRGQGQPGRSGRGALGGFPTPPGAGAESNGGGPPPDQGQGLPNGGGEPTAPGEGRFPGSGFGGGGFGGERGGFRGRGGTGGGAAPGGRLQFAIYHTVFFRDQYQVVPGGPVLDLLNGSPAGGAGGQYRHEIEAQFGYTDNGYGARLSADWRSGTTVFGGGAASTGTLEFSDAATVTFRLWDDFTSQRALVERVPILRGVRVTLNITNLFNQSVQVRDSAGPTPFIYQTALLDPTGRVVSVNLRKIFY